MAMPNKKEFVTERPGNFKLACWFSLSYASYLTMPRVMMEAMPDEWQDKMADLLNEYDEAFPNQPNIGTRVQITDARGNLIKTPPWLLQYRRPDRNQINRMRKRDFGEIEKDKAGEG